MLATLLSLQFSYYKGEQNDLYPITKISWIDVCDIFEVYDIFLIFLAKIRKISQLFTANLGISTF